MTQEQQDEKNLDKAKKLFGERSYLSKQMVNWKASKDRSNLIARARRLAAKVDASRVDSGYNNLTVMYLDSIAVREGFEINFKNEL